MNDVVALGELLIDFTPHGISEQGNNTLEVNPGGAPCNVLSILNKLGCKTEFIGKVGNDGFGRLLEQTLIDEGIGTDGLILSNEYNTTAAFVHLDENGDRSFSFYRNIGADTMLSEDEVSEELIKNSKVFHFGTLSLTHELARKATKKAVKIAKENNLLVSFDPNYRPLLWDSEERAKEAIIYGLENCDIVKISDNELEFVTGISDINEGIIKLKDTYDIKLILVTLGDKGSMYSYDGCIGYRSGFKAEALDTTGAGDSFCGAMIYKILDKGIDNISIEYLDEALDFANAAASIVITKKGALKSMPNEQDINEVLIINN
ncbi:MAG: carbohydrate kinase family protein [Peptostreptococcaceae bacterium]